MAALQKNYFSFRLMAVTNDVLELHMEINVPTYHV
jgi:hypothetical protein